MKTSVALAAALLLATPLAASAQIQPIVSRFDVERFTPPAMAECSLVVGCGEAGAAGTFRVALAGYLELRPLVLREGSHVTGGGEFGNREYAGDVVRDRSGAVLAAAYALRDGLEVHGTWYLVGSQAGDDLSLQRIEAPGGRGTGSPTMGVRWTTWSQARGAPVTGALRLDLVPPLGWPEALAGNPGWLVQPRLELANWSDTSVMTAELGGDLRSRTVQLGVDRLGNALTWALAVAGRARPMWAELALRGIVSGQGYGVELLLGIRLQAGPVELFLLSGRGGGPAAGTPDLRVLVGAGWSGAGGAPGAPPAGQAPSVPGY